LLGIQPLPKHRRFNLSALVRVSSVQLLRFYNKPRCRQRHFLTMEQRLTGAMLVCLSRLISHLRDIQRKPVV
jgi:hypothetical protein